MISRHGIALNSVGHDYNRRVRPINWVLNSQETGHGNIQHGFIHGSSYICWDGIHFNAEDMRLYYQSFREARIMACSSCRVEVVEKQGIFQSHSKKIKINYSQFLQ